MGWFSDLGNTLSTGLSIGTMGLSDGGTGISNAFGLGAGDPSNPDRDQLRQLAQTGAGMGQAAWSNYLGDRGGLGGTMGYLQGQMQGQNSVSALQLQQALQQNQAAQQSMAAGASPRNAAMAARTAMINSANLGAGLAGQQALAGLQERNAAAQQLGGLQLQQTGQDLNAAQMGYGLAGSSYGTAIGNPQKTWGGVLGGALGGFAGGLGNTIGKTA